MPQRFKRQINRHYCKRAEKVIFPTELDVNIELAHHQFRGTESRGYKCQWGKHYHITTQEKRSGKH